MKKFLSILLIAFAAFSCSDKEDEQPVLDDPLMGMWQMVALEQDGQIVDIRDQPCLKDSNLNVTQNTMALTLSAPQQQGGTDCQTESASLEWVNDDGTYYVVEDGERKPAIFSLEEDQLNVNITMDGAPLSLLFIK
ncbi:MAG TPA: hypothetical protein VKX33_08675 [Cyclobacteriaceae bacterium]|nr:hypothetical protein [Cyclobacteriaceae bacterium]